MTTGQNGGTGNAWRIAGAIAISAVFLAWALWDIEPEAVIREIRSAKILPILGAVVVATATFGIRLIRWRILLRGEEDRLLPWTPLWHAVAIGFMANNVLPLRAGELIRAYTAARLTRTRLTSALSSVAVERLFDGIAVVALLAIGLFLSGLPTGSEVAGMRLSSIAVTMGLLFSGALLVAALVVAFPRVSERLVRKVIPSSRLADRLVSILEGLTHGLSALRSPGRFARVALWSVILWLANAFSFYIAFSAFHIPVNFGGALLLQGILVFAIAVPTAPGFVGAFELAIKAVLLLYGIGENRAVSYALVYHTTTFLPITLLGFWSLLRTGLGLRSLKEDATA